MYVNWCISTESDITVPVLLGNFQMTFWSFWCCFLVWVTGLPVCPVCPVCLCMLVSLTNCLSVCVCVHLSACTLCPGPVVELRALAYDAQELLGRCGGLLHAGFDPGLHLPIPLIRQHLELLHWTQQTQVPLILWYIPQKKFVIIISVIRFPHATEVPYSVKWIESKKLPFFSKSQ